MFTLVIEDSEGSVADEYSFEEGEFIVGRSHSSDIILPSDNVSRRHARLYTQNGRCFVEDLNSSNGVFVNGKRTNGPEEVVGKAQIKVGDYYLHVDAPTGSPAPAPAPASGPEPAHYEPDPVEVEYEQPPPDAGGRIYGRLIGTNLATEGKPFDVTRPVSLVGRGKDCAITIIDQSISRIHAKVLSANDGSLVVEDLRSSNGTYVNDERVDRSGFGHGDRLRFGNVEFICELPGMGEVEVVEVSSGGRRGLIAMLLVLFFVLLGGGVAVFLLRDHLWTDPQVTAQALEQAREEAAAAEKARVDEEFDTAQRQIERVVDRARRLAGKGQWESAEKELEKGKALLDEKGAIDTRGELTAYFETEEVQLRDDRRRYEEFVDLLEKADYAAAGRAWKRIAEADGPHRRLARTRLVPVRDKLVAQGEALCAENVLQKCLEKLQQAKALDPKNEQIAARVGKIRIKLSTASPESPDASP